MDTALKEQYLHLMCQWTKEGLSAQQILDRLQHQEISTDTANLVFTEWKKRRTEQKRLSGICYIGVGAGLLLLSFLITFILFETDHNFAFYLYGFTLVGITLLIKGLVDFLGW